MTDRSSPTRPIALAVVMLTAIASTGAGPASGPRPPDTAPRAIVSFGKLPLHFEANRGQTDDRVRFLARGRGYDLFLTSTESVLVLRKPEPGSPGTSPSRSLRMALRGANPDPTAVGREELPGKSHYFIGNDPKRWRTDIPQYARAEYRDVYPGVSLAYYGNQGQLEYDFIVSPGGDPRQIRFGIEGAEQIRVDSTGDLVLSLPGGDVIERAPIAYQEADGARTAVVSRFVLRGGAEVGFEVGAYDRDRPLVLDPVLLYSTFLGGSDFEQANAVALDLSGNAYVTGITGSANFPTSAPIQAANGGFFDAFVVKINAAGTALAYSTYIGGSNADDARGIAVDGSGNAYVTGRTISTNFPTVNPIQAAHGGGVYDAFVTKLDPAGSAILYSTYLGGSGDDVATAIAVDAQGNPYVAGITDSTDLPTANALQATSGGGGDAFVAEIHINPPPLGSTLVYCTYLGGSNYDGGVGIAVDVSGAYVTGVTFSSDFPTASPLQATRGGGGDAFVTKLGPGGSALVYSTYLGGSGFDSASGIAVDASGNAYITGFTDSTDLPTAAPLQAASAGSGDAFVAMLNGAGSALVYSTYIGGSNYDRGQGIAVDASGRAHVTGQTGSANFPTLKPYATAGGGNSDAFVSTLSPVGSLVYSTYLGGSGFDRGSAIATDGAGNAVIVGVTDSTDWPTAGPMQAVSGGNGDAFVARLGIGSPPRGDFNADGRPDILWRNQSTGADATWWMNGTTLTGGASLPAVTDVNWQVVGTSDFNADDSVDVLWRHRITGDNLVWFMNGTTISSGAVLSAVRDVNWQIVGTADFNGDGKPDILWRHRVTGDNLVWFMNGTTVSSGAVLDPVGDVNWQIAGAADFNADGKPDILWRNRVTGDNLVWFMDGTTVSSGAVLDPVSDTRWVIGGLGDFNGDSKPDILWRNQATGDNLVWFMNGTTIAGGVVLPAVSDTNWRIVGPR